jgi:hypothetical protein
MRPFLGGPPRNGASTPAARLPTVSGIWRHWSVRCWTEESRINSADGAGMLVWMSPARLPLGDVG